MEFANIIPESYEKLGAKLLYLCKERYGSDVNIRPVAAFSDRDSGQGNAMLWLTKHFGVFPMEIGGPNGELDLDELTEFTPPSSLTLIIQSVPLFRGGPENRNKKSLAPVDGNVSSTQLGNIKVHAPGIDGSTASFEKTSSDRLVYQIGELNKLLASNRKK